MNLQVSFTLLPSLLVLEFLTQTLEWIISLTQSSWYLISIIPLVAQLTFKAMVVFCRRYSRLKCRRSMQGFILPSKTLVKKRSSTVTRIFILSEFDFLRLVSCHYIRSAWQTRGCAGMLNAVVTLELMSISIKYIFR